MKCVENVWSMVSVGWVEIQNRNIVSLGIAGNIQSLVTTGSTNSAGKGGLVLT